ncbi:hypothetical protein MOUN0_J02696 [Monosporozyma unispora]|nr:hypothetical protein C6P44_002829 [Kazachstania unispora]
MLRNGSKNKNSRSKRQSGFFTSKSDNASVSFSQIPNYNQYSNTQIHNSTRHSTRKQLNIPIPPLQETLQTVQEINNTNDNAGDYYSTVRSPSEQSISSNLSFLSKNSSVLDLIYQDLEQSETIVDEGETTTKSEETFSRLDTKALFVIKNDARDKGQWKLLNDESDPTIDYYPEFSHNVQYSKIERTELDFS